MEGKSRSHSASPSTSLFEVGATRPNDRVVGHVVVGSEDLHLRLARVDHEHDIVDRHAALRDVRRQNDLEEIQIRHNWTKVQLNLNKIIYMSSSKPW